MRAAARFHFFNIQQTSKTKKETNGFGPRAGGGVPRLSAIASSRVLIRPGRARAGTSYAYALSIWIHIHTAHLAPFSDLPFDPCRRQLRYANLQSRSRRLQSLRAAPIANAQNTSQNGVFWVSCGSGWLHLGAPGARIYALCSPSPNSTFDPGNYQHDPQSVISIFHLQPSPTCGRIG